MEIKDTLYFKFKELHLAKEKLKRSFVNEFKNNIPFRVFVILWLIAFELILIFVK